MKIELTNYYNNTKTILEGTPEELSEYLSMLEKKTKNTNSKIVLWNNFLNNDFPNDEK